MNARQLPATDYNGLKSAWRTAVKRVGGERHAADLTRVGQQQISRYGSPEPEHGESFPPVDVLADIEAEVGPVVTRELALLTNHILVPLPQVGWNGSPLGRITGKAMKETADVFSRMGQMLEDGVMTKVEGVQLRKEIHEAMVALAMLDLQVQEEAKRERAAREGER